MGLDVDLKTKDGKSLQGFMMDNNGYFWYLYPYFKEITGHAIDLYDDATFYGKDLDILAEKLNKALDTIKLRPTEWAVHMGTQMKPTKKEIYSAVNKKTLLNLLKDS